MPHSNDTSIHVVTSSLPTVVIFGRVNVGKSTLFNKLSGKASALVSKIAGTTRDINKTTAEWQGAFFQLVDTGGILEEKFLSGKHKLKAIRLDTEDIDTLVQLRARTAIKTADIILFVIDAKVGVLEQDRRLGLLLKKNLQKHQRLVLVANKVDTAKDRGGMAELHALSLGEPLAISAATGAGTGDLLDAITAQIKNLSMAAEQKQLPVSADTVKPINVVILGKPNVGKSSLLNAILGENAVIVSPLPHTTREPQDITVRYRDYTFKFVDTAGIVKKTSKANKDALIKAGMGKSLGALRKADVALLVVDITEDLSHQETKLADEILQSNVNLIIVANKWDAAEDKDAKTFSRKIYSTLPFVQWAPIIFLSARYRTKLTALLDEIITSARARSAVVAPDKLSAFLESAARHAVPLSDTKMRGILKRKLPKPQLKKLEQTRTNPPVFTLTIKAKMGIKGNYLVYLENRLRREFKLVGTPVKINVIEQ